MGYRRQPAVVITDPGVHEFLRCEICKEFMDIQRDCPSVGGFAGAMLGRNKIHDKFTCPYNMKDWHRQASSLHHEICKTPSSKLAKIMKEELDLILQLRQITKEEWSDM